MGHHLAEESHRKTLSDNCMLEDWKDRDEIFNILRKYFIFLNKIFFIYKNKNILFLYFILRNICISWETGGGARGCGRISVETKRPENKNVFYIFPPVVHESKVASILPSTGARAAPCHLFLCSQQVKAPANSAV